MRTRSFIIAANRASGVVNQAVLRGILPKLKGSGIKCVDCKLSPANRYDHRDYDKPMDVEPVCAPCNARRGNAAFNEHPIATRYPIQTATLIVRMYPEELDAIRKLAKIAGKTVADWVRGNLIRKSK